jgi:CCR4-NOT transcription complex subunit 1
MLEEGQKDERWDVYAKLMETLLVFTGQLIKPTGETLMAQQFYRGVLRVLLVIHHDFPEFLVENHFRFCNSVPMHCTQLRNLIVSAYPSTITEMPDPFTAGLKVDRLEKNLQAPVIRADIEQVLLNAGVKTTMDNLLRSPELQQQDMDKLFGAIYYAQTKSTAFELVPTIADPALIHAVTLYIGMSTLGADGANAPLFDDEGPAARLLEVLVKELQPEARFHLISAIANQLRFPNTHTHFYSYALLHLFGVPDADSQQTEIQENITRVLLERLLVHRPHPWGLIITLLEILKNRNYAFWELPFVKAAPEVCHSFISISTQY